MAPIEQDPGYDEATDEVARARDALFGAQWRGYVARALNDAAGGGSGGFRVEPQRLVEAIKRLDVVLNSLDKVRNSAMNTSFDPPGYDDVSINMAQNGAIMSMRAAEYVSAWIGQVVATRDALEQDLDAYIRTDEANSGRRA